MNWRVVEIPSEYKIWSREELLQTLLHEWGHRMISPLSPERGAILRRAAEKEGLAKKQAQDAVNIATDLWLDRQYLQDPDWKAIYWKGMRESIRKLKGKLGPEDAPWPAALAALYTRLLQITAPAGGMLQSAQDPLQEPLEFLTGCSGAPEEETRSTAQSLREALYGGDAKRPRRIREVARILRGFLPEARTTLVSVSHSFKTDEEASLTPSLRRLGRKVGLTEQDLSDLFSGSAEEIRQRTTRLGLYKEIVPVLKQSGRRDGQGERQGHARWTEGDRPRELDALASLQRGGALLPGVTTLSSRRVPEGTQDSETGCGCVCLVVDDSGSTSGQTLQREQEAAFAVIAAARRFDDPVGMVVFGSSVTASMSPTSKYGKIERAIAGLSSESGGTKLTPALTEALDHFSSMREGALMIMTDAGFYDEDSVTSRLNAFPSSIECTAFCFGGEDSIRDAFAEASASTSVYAASPDKPFAETALNELYYG
jgi:hypothetical protein